MVLSLDQRLDSLEVRLNELHCWTDRDYLDLEGWTFDGQPWRQGDRWPGREAPVTVAHGPVTVPQGWPVERTWLDLNLGGEGLLRIRYGRGEEPWGLDSGHRRFPLRDGSFSLEASVVPRLPFGVPNRDARLEWARLVLLEPDLLQLVRRLRLLIDTGRALIDQEVAEPLIAIGERALATLDWPSETRLYLARSRNTERMLSIWEPPRDVDLHPAGLNAEQRESVAAASSQLERDLPALCECYPQHGRLAATGHAHLDLAWLWPMEETRRKGLRTSATALGLMERYPEFRFNMSTAQLYAFMERDEPEIFSRIQEKVAAGQWEPIGGMWVEPDLNMPTGESLVRQLLYGQRYFRSRFGSTHTVAWLPDCFGFTPALPQILRGAGITGFFTIKVNWSETNRFPHDLFWWEGIDGSRVLAHTFDNPIQSAWAAEPGTGGYNGKPDPLSISTVWKNYRGKHTFPESLYCIGYGDGGGGTSVEMLEAARALESFPALPTLRFAGIQEFYRRAWEAAKEGELPTWNGELYLELHRGTLTTQGRTKYLHRRAERALIAAEVVSGMNALLGSSELPASLEAQWQVVLRNEFHDILPGSSIREVYETTNAELEGVVQAGRQQIERGLETLAARLAPSGDKPALLAVNPDLSARPLRVEAQGELPGGQRVEHGSVVAGAQVVPGLGAAVLREVQPVGSLQVSERRLENDYLRVALAEDGSLKSVHDKRVNREVLSGRGNQLWAYVDKPRNWDAWDVQADYPREGEEITDLQSISVLESGPHRAAIRVQRRFRHSRISQDIRLWANSARLEFVTTLDWHDRHYLLRARFPLTVRSGQAAFETAFGVIERPTRRNTSWEEAKFEVAGHRFADLSEPGYGVALLNDGKYGYDALESELGLSLLRSPTFPDPYADEGEQTFTYALYPHPGAWLDGGVLMEAEDLNNPLLVHTCRAGGETSWQALRLQGLPLGLGALKVLEDGGGLLVRAYEPAGSHGQVQVETPDGWALSSETDLLEAPTGEPQTYFGPFQIRSWTLTRG